MSDSEDHDQWDNDGCWNCDGDGYVWDCIDGCCENAEDGCDLCTRRCDVCNAPRRSKQPASAPTSSEERSDTAPPLAEAGV